MAKKTKKRRRGKSGGEATENSSSAAKLARSAAGRNRGAGESPQETTAKGKIVDFLEPDTSSDEYPAASGGGRNSAEGHPEVHTTSKRKQKDSEGDLEIRIGYYNANFAQRVTTTDQAGVEAWMRSCAEDMVAAIKDDSVNVLCLVGLGPYGLSDLHLRLPEWLKRYDVHPMVGLLKYLVKDAPGIWHVWSLHSYGIMVSVNEVSVIKDPILEACHIQKDMPKRPMVCFEVGAVVADTKSPTRFQVWVVDNEGNAMYPMTFLARENVLRFLLAKAGPRAIWGGKMNSSLISLTEAATRHFEKAMSALPASSSVAKPAIVTSVSAGAGWSVLPSVTGHRDALALHRGLQAEGFDIPCSSLLATFFGVTVRVPAGCVEKPTRVYADETNSVPQLAKHIQSYADQRQTQGDERTQEIVHAMLQFLWWGNNFQPNSSNALQEGYRRLDDMTMEIRRVRRTYSRVAEPADDHHFDPNDMKDIHRNYMWSLTWMDAERREDYERIVGNPRPQVKNWFNVYFRKVWGSKHFFMHLVRFGMTSDVAAMVRVFGKFRRSKEYKELLDANSAKSQELRDLWLERQRLRFRAKRFRATYADQQAYEDAKSEYESLGRGNSGVAQATWVEEARSSVTTSVKNVWGLLD